VLDLTSHNYSLLRDTVSALLDMVESFFRRSSKNTTVTNQPEFTQSSHFLDGPNSTISDLLSITGAKEEVLGLI